MSNRRVVIADDESIIRLDLKEILLESGFDVVGESARGDEAIDLVRELKPDLAILDIKMPGLDGVSAASIINEEMGTPVLLLTAFSQRDLIQSARDAGVAAYLVKPFQREELIPAIENVLFRAHQEQALSADMVAPAADGAAEDKLVTRQIVEDAKASLMEAGLSEQEAFDFIQKTAMRERLRMRAVAEQVIAGELAP
jgi:two-component system, response regulator PdtaR